MLEAHFMQCAFAMWENGTLDGATPGGTAWWSEVEPVRGLEEER